LVSIVASCKQTSAVVRRQSLPDLFKTFETSAEYNDADGFGHVEFLSDKLEFVANVSGFGPCSRGGALPVIDKLKFVGHQTRSMD
jgi:hypothetical protein